jgi:hypothetical protein
VPGESLGCPGWWSATGRPGLSERLTRASRPPQGVSAGSVGSPGGRLSSSRTGRGALAGTPGLRSGARGGENLPDDGGVFDGGHGRQSSYAAGRGGVVVGP